jgi:hypothetical protein
MDGPAYACRITPVGAHPVVCGVGNGDGGGGGGAIIGAKMHPDNVITIVKATAATAYLGGCILQAPFGSQSAAATNTN